jgi:hypothetical protein
VGGQTSKAEVTTLATPRRIISLVDEAELAALRDEPWPKDGSAEGATYYWAMTEKAERLWRLHGARIVAEWIEKHPGTRPTFWWRFDAPRWRPTNERFARCYYVKQGELPEPRRRLGGTGTPACERLAYAPAWPLGIPTDWDIDFDANDPPMYEAQASYLKRHRLLAPGELKRLTKKDFEAEAAVDLLHEYEDEAEA